MARKYRYEYAPTKTVPEWRCPVLVDGKMCGEMAGALGEKGQRALPTCVAHGISSIERGTAP